jgi:predicted RNA-binding protein YlxR (DUF448 family)
LQAGNKREHRKLRATGRGPARHRKTPAEAPVRQCIVCRTSQAPEALLQVGLQATELDPAAKPGRRAYVCIAKACLLGLHGKSAGRAFKGAVELDAPAHFEAQVHGLAETRLFEIVGLARRAGELVGGVDRLASEPEDAFGLIMVAEDASERAARRLSSHRAFGTTATLGRAAGTAPVAAIGIRPGRLAMQAAYWLRVWYETHSRDGQDAAGSQPAGDTQQNGSGHGTPDSRLIEVA